MPSKIQDRFGMTLSTISNAAAECWQEGVDRLPAPGAVYQTPPSRAGATSWGRDPAGTGNACNVGSLTGAGSVGGISNLGGGSVVESSRDAEVGSAMT